MSNTARVIGISIGLVLVASMMVGAVLWGMAMRPSDAPCKAITYIIEDKDERLYVTEGELTQVLITENIYPVGRAIDRGLLHRIESAMRRHPMIRTAECYTTPRHEVRVRVTQRVPLLRVYKPGDAFIIDTDRKVMPVRASIQDSVLVATGAVGVQIASGDLADFAQWLQRNTYWQARIDHVYVQSPQKIYLYLKGTPTRVVLGTMTGYERKLAKLRTFMENSPEQVKAKQYTELDLRYKGQVIGRK